MNKNSTIHVRVNENVRANAEETLSMLGMTISDAVNMLLHQVNLVGGLPFDLKIPASARNIVRNSTELHQKLDEAEFDFKAWKDNHYRASLKTRLIKEKPDRCGSCKETFRRRAAALRGRLTQQMLCIAVFSQKGFLEMPYISRWFIEKDHGVLLEVTPFDIIPVEVINDYEK